MAHPLYCFICADTLDNGSETRVVKQKGINGLIARSKLKKDDRWKCLENLTEVKVHEQCRVSYLLAKTKKSYTAAPQMPPPEAPFSFKDDCFLCHQPWDPKHKPGRQVCTPNTQEVIKKWMALRADEWSEKVNGKIEGKSLLDENARYHISCYEKFKYIPKKTPGGLSRLPGLDDAFQGVCNYMEASDDCQFTFKELMDKLEGVTTSRATLKQRLINKYGTDILMLERTPKPTVICFRNTGYKILENFWKEQNTLSEEEERLRIVNAAAAIIREDIRSQAYETSSYPRPEELLQNVEADIPKTLLTLLDEIIFKGKRNPETKLITKRNSIAHSIVSAVRPRSFISSIQLATGVYLSRKLGSRLIIDVLEKLGLCTSYTNLSLYEASAIMSCDKEIENDAYIQHVFHNADHNVSTLDGSTTFNSMGGICCVTPTSGVSTQGVIQKLTRTPKARELAAKCNIPVVCCDRLDNTEIGLKKITFADVSQLLLGDRDKLPAAYNLYLWAKCLQIPNMPSWRGFMEALCHTEEYEVTQVLCLPFVNLPPSHFDAINTVLNHARVQCLSINQTTSFVTFDQPLYIKARELLASDQGYMKGVVVKLGGFHMLMSLLGAIGTIMDGSGLNELLTTVYAPDTVDHMLTGHAFSRAIRGHLLVYAALGTIIARNASNIDDEDRSYMANFLEEFDIQPPRLDEVHANEQLWDISGKMLEVMETLANVGRTSRLWLQYFDCITLVMQFIEAERLGNWELHLKCVRDMLPIFHAAGHLTYATSAQIYLQDMMELPNIMDPQEYDKFTKQGYFTIRRSDKKWAGIWTDITLEQMLMRMMKIYDGLTHGRGINREGAVARWILGMPVAFEVMNAFENFCGVKAESTEQHTDWRPSSIKRDTEDCMKFIEWLTIHDPFVPVEGNRLMSIADGLCGGDEVNSDRAMEIGKESMKSIIGVNAADINLNRTTRVKSLATVKRGISFDNEKVAVNTTLLYQRITAVTKNDHQSAAESFHHELAPFPLSLFDALGWMREPTKFELFKAFSSKPISTINLSEYRTVIDGGFLLHKLVWPVGSTYEAVFKLYESYVVRNYGTNSVVVFDGYEDTDIGIKSYKRFRRSKAIKSNVVMFEKEMIITVNQENFLSNDKNKSRLISFLSNHLVEAGITVKQASEDADRSIATTAVDQLTDHRKVAVVGQNDDLLVLLIALTPADREIHFIKQGTGKAATAVFSTQDLRHLKDVILFNHAFTGCDTTSAIYNKGKRTFLNILKKSNKLTRTVEVFNNPNAARNHIKQAGERLMLALYGANKKQSSINSYRFECFADSAARLKAEVRLAQLPPTAGATEEHVWRVYFQIQKWLGNDLDPCEWGWELKEQIYYPVMTKMPAAPAHILEMIFCTCKGNCSDQCGCIKAGLKCSNICSGCHGDSCLNSMEIDISTDSAENSNNPDDILLENIESTLSHHIDQVDIEEYDDDNSDFLPFENPKDNSEDESGPSVRKKRRIIVKEIPDEWTV